MSIGFDNDSLTTVVIGQNGAGKSNLIEAIIDVFRFVDENRGEPRFSYRINYAIDSYEVELNNIGGKPLILVDDKRITRAFFEKNQTKYFPDLVFGYYSGASRRLEKLFDSHQRRYYDAIKTNNDADECKIALQNRRLFYCRPIHGTLALISFFSFPDKSVTKLLKDKLGVTGFHSLLAIFRQPWFSTSTKSSRLLDAFSIWGAAGPAGTCARMIRDSSFHPIALEDKPIDDYRDKGVSEAQLAAFLRDKNALASCASAYIDDRDMFAALEAIDISDLIREMHLWIIRLNDTTGNISFADLSDGERQLLMVLGLIRVSRGKRALFLLDEPDTHLNPTWQLAYLNLIREWTGIAANTLNCQIILTSHNPLTIAALKKEEVRVMTVDENHLITVSTPYTDPRGLGFTATLTEIFGLPTSLDNDTQALIDERNALAGQDKRNKNDEKKLILLNDKLNRLGFMFEDREPLYQDFLLALKNVRYADRPPLSPEQVERRHQVMQNLINSLTSK